MSGIAGILGMVALVSLVLPLTGSLCAQTPTLGPNLLTNPGFEQLEPAYWVSTGVQFDATVSHSGTRSARVENAPAYSLIEAVRQDITLSRGVYRIRGLVKTDCLGDKLGGGVRLTLRYSSGKNWKSTPILTGTLDWRLLELGGISIPEDGPVSFSAEAYGRPDGRAWFDDLELREEFTGSLTSQPPAPVQAPLLSGVQISNVTASSATVLWTVTSGARCTVQYGLSTSYSSAVMVPCSTGFGQTTLMGLDPGRIHHVQVVSTFENGPAAFSPDITFSTSESFTPGGVTDYTKRLPGPNLIQNGDFESSIPTTGKQSFWSDNGFATDTNLTHSGRVSFRLQDANLVPYTQMATQTVSLRAGIYRLGGWIKTQNVGRSAQGAGVRLTLLTPTGWSSTDITAGTTEWHYVTLLTLIKNDTSATVRLEAYKDADGTAWFDDIELREELRSPIEAWMRQPRFRGILFDDEPSVMQIDATITPPAGRTISEYTLRATIVNQASGTTVYSQTFPASKTVLATLTPFGLLNDTYLVKLTLIDTVKNLPAFESAPFRVVKVPASTRSSMATSFDQYNRILLHGKPTFILGVYDAGLGAPTSEASWETSLQSDRRLFDLPINFYLNYWFGNQNNVTMMPLLNVLYRHNINMLTNANCFANSPVDSFPYWFLSAPDAEVAQRGRHPAFAGFYAADECEADQIPNVFPHYDRMRRTDPDGLVFGAFNGASPLWAESVDLVGTDPYPLYAKEPAGGYALNKVADWARETKASVRDSRPFVMTIQFFKFTSLGRWPTTSELRNMSYMAITEGASGLFYWSLGTNALAYVCQGWCPEKQDYFERLRAVMNELKGIEGGLAGVDHPEYLPGNTNPTAIRTRVKLADGKAYVFAYNYTNTPASTTFGWHAPLSAISVYNEARTVAPAGGVFSDTFGPYAAHVYVLNAATPMQ